VVLMAGHTYAYNGIVQRLRDMVRNNELGRLHYVDSARLNLGLYRSDVSVVWDLAAHDIAIMNFVLDSTPEVVAARSGHVANPRFDDIAYLWLEYGGHQIAGAIHVSWLDPCKVRRVTIVGSERMAVFNDLSTDAPLKIYDKGVEFAEGGRLGDGRRGEPPLSYRYGDIHAPYLKFEEPLLVEDQHFLDVHPGRPPAHRRPIGTRGRRGPRRRRRVPSKQHRGEHGRVPEARGMSGPAPVPFVDLAPIHADIHDELLARMAAIVARGDFVGGGAVAEFEEAWAHYCGRRHAVGVANGTDALELALRALGIGPGDEVIVPANTFVATPEAVVAAGAAPHFVDVDPETLLVTPHLVADAIGPRTAAVIPVHLYGQVADMDGIVAVARRAGIAVVEDAAQAHGATWRRRAGSFGEVGCFSFYPGKNLGAFGDAGAVVTDDAALAARVRSIANHGRSASSRHSHDAVGMNSRLDTLQAAVLLVKLPHLDEWNGLRRRAAARYRARFAEMAGVEPVAIDPRAGSVHHLEVVRLRNRDVAAEVLRRGGVGTGLHYPVPCHRQCPFAADVSLPVCEAAASEILSLPMYAHLSDEQVDRVVDTLAEVLP
jgi:dTDP-4-amino-4,6-dideoxygalactose transaminase